MQKVLWEKGEGSVRHGAGVLVSWCGACSVARPPAAARVSACDGGRAHTHRHALRRQVLHSHWRGRSMASARATDQVEREEGREQPPRPLVHLHAARQPRHRQRCHTLCALSTSVAWSCRSLRGAAPLGTAHRCTKCTARLLRA
eukprot:831766-Rhodomonas_salina.1